MKLVGTAPFAPASPGPRTGDKRTGAHIPLVRPDPPRLSQHTFELAAIEESGVFSNYGPTNTKLEQAIVHRIFRQGQCLSVCNATIGLMMAIREVIGEDRPAARRYALMPSFTFAATAHAALWCGLTPLFCDIDPETWLPSHTSEEALLRRYAGEIAVVVPYATFGNNLDLVRYGQLSEKYGVPIVVDAAASLGSIDEFGKAFGTGFPWPLVFSMHATKAFSVGEGGLIYCGDQDRIARLRSMGAFGFGESRSASMIGLNSKLTEVAALTALLQLERFPAGVQQRGRVAQWYRTALRGEFPLQRRCGYHQVCAFQSILLPRSVAPFRAEILAELASHRIGAGNYFSPHLAEQPYFQRQGRATALPVTEDIASRIVSLPLLPAMSLADVSLVASTLRLATNRYRSPLKGGASAINKQNPSPAVEGPGIGHGLSLNQLIQNESERKSA